MRWSRYAWLTAGEVATLRAALAALESKRPEVASRDFISGFHRELAEWLDQVQARGGELWLYAT